jgi:hypothetical protein
LPEASEQTFLFNAPADLVERIHPDMALPDRTFRIALVELLCNFGALQLLISSEFCAGAPSASADAD